MLSTPRSQTLAAAALLLALVFLVFGAGLGNELVFDDHRIIERNPVVRTLNPGVHLSNPFWSRWADPNSYYRPAVTYSLALDRALWSGSPVGYHLTNLLMHALSALLLFLLVRELGGPLAAAVAAALFAVHPVTSEAVLWAVGRTDLQATLFLLLALWLHAGLPDRPGRRDLPRLGAALLALGVALGSKEMAVTFPALALAFDLARGRSLGQGWREAFRRTALRAARILPFYLGLMAVYAVAHLRVGGGEFLEGLEPEWAERSENPLRQATVSERLLTAVNVAGRNLALLLYPAKLSVLYTAEAVPLVRRALSVAFLLPLAALLAAGGLLLLAARRLPAALFGLLAAGGTYLLVSHLLFTAPIPMAERTLYLPLAGLAAVAASLIVALAERVSPEGRAALVAGSAAALLVLPLGLRSRARVPDWKDDLALFGAAVRDQPLCAGAWRCLAAEQLERGDLVGSLASADRAVEIFPRYATSHLLRSEILRRMGDLPSAEKVLRDLDAEMPGNRQVHINLAQILAARAAEEAARGRAALAAGLRAEIVELAGVQAEEAAAEGQHGVAAAFLLEEARALDGLGRAGEAREAFEASRAEVALEVAAGGAIREKAHGLEATVLGSYGDFLLSQRETAAAAEAYREAASAGERAGLGPLAGGMRTNQGRALQALGKGEEALAAFREAERLAPRDDLVREQARAGQAFILAAEGETAAVAALVPRGFERSGLAAAVWLAAAEGASAAGRWSEALTFYDRQLVLRPEGVRGLHGRGRARLALGRGEGAEEDLRAALERAPTSRSAAALLLDLARAALMQGEEAEARERLGQALQADEVYGEALLRRGLAAAAEAAHGPGSLDPRLAAEAWYRLGELEARRGEAAAAEGSLRRCLGLEPGHRGARALLRSLG